MRILRKVAEDLQLARDKLQRIRSVAAPEKLRSGRRDEFANAVPNQPEQHAGHEQHERRRANEGNSLAVRNSSARVTPESHSKQPDDPDNEQDIEIMDLGQKSAERKNDAERTRRPSTLPSDRQR